MFLKLFAILLSMFVLSVIGQYIHHGECRTDVEVVQDFDFDKVILHKEFVLLLNLLNCVLIVLQYMVKWFEIQRYDLQFQLNSECSQSRFDKAVDASATVMNSWNMSKNRRRTYIHGRATLADPLSDPQVGKLIVSFDRLQPGTSANYWILDTDYSNYSVVWYCYGIGNGNIAGRLHLVFEFNQLSRRFNLFKLS